MDLSPRRLLAVIQSLLPYFLAGFLPLFAFRSCNDQEPELRFVEVTVADTVLIAAAPDTVVRWREKILRPVVEPARVAVAPTAGLADVERFCAAAGYRPPLPAADLARPSIARPSPVEPQRASVFTPPERVLLVSAWTHDGEQLRVWGPRSDGSKAELTYKVRTPYSAVVKQDELLVQRERFSLPPAAVKVGYAVLGVAVGYSAAELF